MIEVEDSSGERTRFVVQGNQSMSWRANLWLAASLGVICMGIAVALATFGLWLVIPFAGAEVILIVTCLYLTLKRLSHKEVITVEDEAIRLEWGYTRPERVVDLPRQWARLRFHSPESAFHTGDLSVAAHGRSYALGCCLNKEEKKSLHAGLAAALQRRYVALKGVNESNPNTDRVPE